MDDNGRLVCEGERGHGRAAVLISVGPQDLAQHWAFVEAGLKDIIRKTGEQWTPTHVRQGINDGWAFLHVSEDGFVVTQPHKEAWTSEPYLQVWAMWFKPGKAKEKRAELIAWLDQQASPFVWKFGSPREGWCALEGECEIERTIWRRKK